MRAVNRKISMNLKCGRIKLTLLAFTAVLMAGGCFTPGASSPDANNTRRPTPQEQPQLGPVSKLTNAEGISLPLDYYQATPQQRVTLATAFDILIKDCMKRFGFDWAVQARPVEPGTGRRYGISNATDVANYGYHLSPQRKGGSQPKAGSFTPPSAAEQTVFNGDGPSVYKNKTIPQGGCNGEAAHKFGLKDVNEPFVTAGPLLQALDGESNNSTRVDTRVRDVWTKWSACMHKSGYDYRDPWDANNDPAWDTKDPSLKEIQTARADLTCRNQFNVAGISLAVETAYQKQLIERNTQALTAGKAKLDARIRQAIDIADGSR